jgi:hypothetical protein
MKRRFPWGAELSIVARVAESSSYAICSSFAAKDRFIQLGLWNPG